MTLYMTPFLKFQLIRGVSMPLTEPDLWISPIKLFSQTHHQASRKNFAQFSVSVTDNAQNIL